MYVVVVVWAHLVLQVEAALHGRGVNLMDHSRLFAQSVKLIEAAMVILIRKKNDTYDLGVKVRNIKMVFHISTLSVRSGNEH